MAVTEPAPIVVDPDRRTVHVRGKYVHFTKLEFDLLAALVNADGRVLSRTYIEEEVWDREVPLDSATVRVHVQAIRRKLSWERRRLQTVRGVGYRLDMKEALS